MARKLEVEIVGDASSLHSALGKADKSASGFGSTIGKLGKAAAFGAGAAGVGALVITLKKGFDELKQGQAVAAQTNAVIKSTGGVANVSAKHVSDLATSLMKKTGSDDEAIASGENLLLTFKNIRNEAGKGNKIFDDAVKVSGDLARAFGKSIPQASVLVGKALNDPVKGLTALQKVGVTFTDGQKKLIKHLVDTGDKLGAQKIIMGELKSEVGGSAEAYGKTLPGMIDIAKESFNNFAGDLVTKLIPVLERVVGWVRDNWPQISSTIKTTWEDQIKPALDAMTDVVTGVVDAIRSNWGTIGPIVQAVGTVIADVAHNIITVLRIVAALLHGDWSKAWQQMKTLVVGIVRQMWDELKLMVTVAGTVGRLLGNALKRAVVAGVTGVAGEVGNLLEKIKSTAASIAGRAASWAIGIGQQLISGILSGLASLPGRLVSLIKSAINAVIDRINSALSFHVSVNTHIPGVGTKSFGYDSNIPHLAAGGIVTGPTVAMIGERGPEAVIPLGRGGGASIVFNFPNYIGSKSDLQQTMREAARSFSDLNGRAVMG